MPADLTQSTAFVDMLRETEKETNMREETEDEYVIERVIDRRVDKTGRAYEYRVRWEGYEAEDDTWEPHATVVGPRLTEFEQQSTKKDGDDGDEKNQDEENDEIEPERSANDV